MRMSELERIARAIDPEAWNHYGHPSTYVRLTPRRTNSLAAAARVQEELREDAQIEWAIARKDSTGDYPCGSAEVG